MDFKLFEDTYKIFQNNEKKEENNEYSEKQCCENPKIILEQSNQICENCGILVNKELVFDKEWRFYGLHDTKHSNDPSRCHIRKLDDITIYKDVDKLGFSEKIIITANHIYEEVTHKKIYRGNSRKGIVFACIFHAYKINCLPHSCESLIQIFNIDRKIALKGLKYVNLNAQKTSIFRNYHISPENIINEIMDKFYASDEQKIEIYELYKKIENKSSLLNRSRPQSVASGLVRYFILKKGKNIPMSLFKSKVNLSELTIHRIVKEIEKILSN